MIVPSDKDYQDTKLIKQGKAEMKSDFKPLCDWINKEYGIKPINIIYDVIYSGGRIPRLQVVLEFWKEKTFFLEPFTYPNQAIANFDGKKQQAIANQFETTLFELGLNTKKSIWNRWQT
ncbi:hypothetical protein [Mucilaginibacter sp.]|uniref:hypothetical protein n=1 Tax=Mucilaginibacter sp. TaxID=1882438 RepID=UPI003266B7BB